MKGQKSGHISPSLRSIHSFWGSTWLTLGSHFGFQVCIHAGPPCTHSFLLSFSFLQCLGVSRTVAGLLALFLVVEWQFLHPKVHNHPAHLTLSFSNSAALLVLALEEPNHGAQIFVLEPVLCPCDTATQSTYLRQYHTYTSRPSFHLPPLNRRQTKSEWLELRRIFCHRITPWTCSYIHAYNVRGHQTTYVKVLRPVQNYKMVSYMQCCKQFYRPRWIWSYEDAEWS